MELSNEYLNMRQAGECLGQTYRWMQRHYVDLIQQGVEAFRVPKDSQKGRLFFVKDSLHSYIDNEHVKMPSYGHEKCSLLGVTQEEPGRWKKK